MRRFVTVLLAVLLVGQAAGLAVAQQQQATRSADIAIEPMQGGVTQSTTNGTATYTVDVAPVDIHPRGFAADAVVDYGVDTPGGELRYESEYGQFRFSANATGTYTVYWVVPETAGNDTRQVRHEVRIRVAESANAIVVTRDENSERSEAAEKWRELNSTVLDDLMAYESWYATEPTDRQELIEKMGASYRSTHDITKQLSGNITQVLIILAFSLGGWLLVGLGLLYHFGSVGALWRQLNQRVRNEAYRGDLHDEQRALDRQRDLFTLENTELQEIEGISEHDAIALREGTESKSLRDVYEALRGDGPLSDAALMQDQLHAMGAAGYGARVTPDGDGYDVGILAPDAVPSGERAVTNPADIAEDGSLVDLAGMDSEMDELLLREVEAWDDGLLGEFDISRAEFDPAEVSYEFDSLDVASVMDAYDLPEDRWENTDRVGEVLLNLAEHVRNHPYSDGRGATNPVRVAMERLLKTENVLADKHHVTDAETRRQALARALEEQDPAAELTATVKHVQSGGALGGD